MLALSPENRRAIASLPIQDHQHSPSSGVSGSTRVPLAGGKSVPPAPSLLPTRAHSAALPPLPAREHAAELIWTVGRSAVTLVQGATGCGKSTQLPQLILEDATKKAAPCNIIVAQPRRLAATALAERVTTELGDPAGCGGIAGYRIRDEARISRLTRITFVTYGVLLRELETDGSLGKYSHVVIDEVHERSVDSDLLLLALRRALMQCEAAFKLILMSATVDAMLYAGYFGRDMFETVCVPGRSFPVDALYLEEAIAESGYRCVPSNRAWAREVPLPNNPSPTAASKANAAAKEAAEAVAAAEAAEGSLQPSATVLNLRDRAKKLENVASATRSNAVGGGATEWLTGLGAVATAGLLGEHVAQTLRAMELSIINEELIEALVLTRLKAHPAAVTGQEASGAALVFLPGVAEIESLAERLARHRGLHVVKLHAQLATAEQRSAFAAAPAGLMKLILATNIAETSVTIPDVTCVIDSGLHRHMQCDERTVMKTLPPLSRPFLQVMKTLPPLERQRPFPLFSAGDQPPSHVSHFKILCHAARGAGG